VGDGGVYEEMRIHKFKDQDDYAQAQIKMGTQGFHDRSLWVTPEEIDAICEYIKDKEHTINFGLCHGVRTGVEVEAFRSGLLSNIIGTDICPVVDFVRNVIVHDFHNVKDEWINSVDFIYTNSLDHSDRPKECLESWFSCLTSEGLCFVEWTPSDNDEESSMSYADCFGATLQEYEDLLNEVGEVIDKIEIPPRRTDPIGLEATVIVAKRKAVI